MLNVASHETGRGKCSWHYGTYGLRFTYVYTHAKPDFTAAVYNAGNQKSQIVRSLLEEICSRRRGRKRFPYIYRNARSVVLVWTRPRLVKARAVKAVHPRIRRTIRETTVLPLRVDLSNCRSSLQMNPLEPNSFKNNPREFQAVLTIVDLLLESQIVKFINRSRFQKLDLLAFM